MQWLLLEFNLSWQKLPFSSIQLSAAFDMKTGDFYMEQKHFSIVHLLVVTLQSSGGTVLSHAEVSVNTLLICLPIPLPCVMYMSTAASSTTAVQRPLSVMCYQLGMKRESALEFKVSFLCMTPVIQVMHECIA